MHDEDTTTTTGPWDGDARTALRELGLRVTPQRRAIVGAFGGGATEHLSADEVHARASAVVPDLGRGTVYATLAELTEVGVLASVGTSEPVRFETNVSAHDHFRCRLCLRLTDIEATAPDLSSLTELGFTVESAATVAEGICDQCVAYDEGLARGVDAVLSKPQIAADAISGLACMQMETSLGELSLAATPDGLVRVAFPEHADSDALKQQARSRRGARTAHGHLQDVRAYISAFLDGAKAPPAFAIDWDAVATTSVESLKVVLDVHFGAVSSYQDLRGGIEPRELGLAYGANPLALVSPCHRINRGLERPELYVGGSDRRRALRLLEHPAASA